MNDEPITEGIPSQSEPVPAQAAAHPETGKTRRRTILRVVACAAVLVAVFLGGRLSAPDHRTATLAAAVQQAQSGSLPCGTLTGAGDKALQRMCAPSTTAKAATGNAATGNAAAHRKSRKSSTPGSASSSSSTNSSSSASTSASG